MVKSNLSRKSAPRMTSYWQFWSKTYATWESIEISLLNCGKRMCSSTNAIEDVVFPPNVWKLREATFGMQISQILFLPGLNKFGANLIDCAVDKVKGTIQHGHILEDEYRQHTCCQYNLESLWFDLSSNYASKSTSVNSHHMVILLFVLAGSWVTVPILAIVSIMGPSPGTKIEKVLSMSVIADTFSLCSGARSSRRFPVIRLLKIMMLARGSQNVIPIDLAKTTEVDFLALVLLHCIFWQHPFLG